MNIQSGYSAPAYQVTGNIGISQTGEILKKAAQGNSQSVTKSTDQVTISASAMALAAKENNPTQGKTPAQERLLLSVASDPQSAEKLASDLANNLSTIIYDIRGTRGDEPLNKLSSGRIIDESFKQKFTSESSVIDAQRKAIFYSEKAKGTDPVQILSKMFDFTNMQSKDYLEATCQRW
jgi:hypothetical protein